MNKPFSAALAAVAVAAMLTACGGGGDSDFFDNEDPEPSNRSGSVTVVGAENAALNGVYASDNVYLNDVEKVDPIGSDPELCRFRFDRLVQAGGNRLISGDVRYQPGTNIVRVMFLAIKDRNGSNGIEYSLPDDADELQGAVNRPSNRIDLVNIRMESGSGDEITVTGNIPMRSDRPEGC